jgi:hypothetical protein
MIALTRQRKKASIPNVFWGHRRVDKELALLKAKRDGTLSAYFRSTLWSKAKPQLKIEANDGKCAYCEAPAAAVAYCDVEHFRPKSIWWWLSCCYDNYVLACQICNQVYKGDSFPLADGGKPKGEPEILASDSDDTLLAMAGGLAPDPLEGTCSRSLCSYEQDCAEEMPLLLSPYLDLPEKVIAYEADVTLREVRVRPRTRAHSARIRACEEHLGINREQLCRDRWRRYEPIEKAFEIWKLANSKLKPRVAQVLSFAVLDQAPFAGMARYFIREVWRVPGV